MKAPLIATLVIAVVGSFWGVKESRHLTTLRERHRIALKEAATWGVSTDATRESPTTKASRRDHGDGIRETKDFANKLVAFAKEMKEVEKSGKQMDEAMRKRIVEMMDEMLSLDSSQLKVLIAELKGRADMDDEMRAGMISFSIIMLSQKHPQAALALFTESSDLLNDDAMSKHALSSSLSQWAKDQPLEALKWIQENAAKHPDLVNDEAKTAVITGAAQNDINLALQLIAELKLPADDGDLMGKIARVVVTPEKQLEWLAALRRQGEGKDGEKVPSVGLRALFSKVSESGFDKSLAWMESANLSADESARFSQSLNYYLTKSDTGKWLDWMGTLGGTSEESDSTTRNLVKQWTQNDYRAAGEWLAQSPAGPQREAATMAYLETVTPYDPDVAAQWAGTLPEAKQKEAYRSIYQIMKGNDLAEAEAFAAKHGIEPED